MYLEIKNPDNLDLKDFCEYLKNAIIQYIKNNIDINQLIRFDAYLNTYPDIIKWKYTDRKASAKDLIISAVYNLIITEYPDKTFVISFDVNQIVPNSYAKFIDIVKLINFGNLSLSAYPIFTNTFNYFAKHLHEYYDKYRSES